MGKDKYFLNQVLGEIGCRFRSNIENHIKDYKLQKGDDVEWLLEPLDAISHSTNIVLDVFQIGTKCESFYKLYFHNKGASQAYVAYDHPIERPHGYIKGNTIYFPNIDEIEEWPKPNPYNKTMLIKGTPEENLMSDVPTIWEDLIVSFTETGVWQAVLLNETIALFPKGWHGNYLEKTYVFSKADMQQIIDSCKSKYYDFTDAEFERLEAYYRSLGRPSSIFKMRGFGFRKSDYERLATFIDREDILPSVEISGDKAIASYYFWNDWSGLCQASVPVERRGQSVSIGQSNEEVLIAYDCGIRY